MQYKTNICKVLGQLWPDSEVSKRVPDFLGLRLRINNVEIDLRSDRTPIRLEGEVPWKMNQCRKWEPIPDLDAIYEGMAGMMITTEHLITEVTAHYPTHKGTRLLGQVSVHREGRAFTYRFGKEGIARLEIAYLGLIPDLLAPKRWYRKIPRLLKRLVPELRELPETISWEDGVAEIAGVEVPMEFDPHETEQEMLYACEEALALMGIDIWPYLERE